MPIADFDRNSGAADLALAQVDRAFCRAVIRGRLRAAAIGFVLFAGSAAPAQAEIVFLTTGRTLSVRSHRQEGDLIVLVLRAGGEITCPRSLVTRITPDEVPYPETTDPSSSLPAALGEMPYREVISDAAARHGLDVALLDAVIRVESNYARLARSPKGAMGLMQLMPATARQYAVADPYDVTANIDAGARHLKTLLNRFDLSIALAAYNAGEAAVERFGGIPPYRETREYVARILGLLKRAGRPAS